MYKRQEFLLVDYTCTKTENSITLEIGERQGEYDPGTRSYELRFNGVEQKPGGVSWNGETLNVFSSESGLREGDAGWTYLEKEKIVVVRIPDRGKRETIEISL